MTRILPANTDSRSDDSVGRRPGLGTLVWIGNRESQYFRDAYAFCESHTSQIAYRANLSEAIERPSTGVSTIICCRENDSIVDHAHYLQLCQKHSSAQALLLMGPLCAGQRPHPSERLQTPAIYWHEWETCLPSQLIRCGLERQSVRRSGSVAVIASSYANASALLTVADDSEVTSAWYRPNQLSTVCNVDQYWWDDSATQTGSWTSRLKRCRNHQAEHFWFAGLLTPTEKRRAVEAGVGLVIPKPGDLTPLYERTRLTLAIGTRRAA